MLDLKKIAIAVLVFSYHIVFAGTIGSACSAVSSTTPCEGTSWDFGARALYLEPSYSAGDYSYVAIDSPTTQYQDYRKSTAWGFFLEGSYHYSTGSDANLNWYHISKSENRDFVGAFAFIDGPGVEEGRAYIDPKWDAVNVEFGQYIDFGENKHIRFHGGFQYAGITIFEKLVGESPEGLTHELAFSYQAKPTYSGFGARAGADMGYDLGYGLGIYSNIAAALLAGSEKINASYTDNLGTSSSVSASKRAVVPELVVVGNPKIV